MIAALCSGCEPRRATRWDPGESCPGCGRLLLPARASLAELRAAALPLADDRLLLQLAERGSVLAFALLPTVGSC